MVQGVFELPGNFMAYRLSAGFHHGEDGMLIEDTHIALFTILHHHFACTLDCYKITNLHATLAYVFLLLLRYGLWL
jgi:hypothetical protein